MDVAVKELSSLRVENEKLKGEILIKETAHDMQGEEFGRMVDYSKALTAKLDMAVKVLSYFADQNPTWPDTDNTEFRIVLKARENWIYEGRKLVSKALAEINK